MCQADSNFFLRVHPQDVLNNPNLHNSPPATPFASFGKTAVSRHSPRSEIHTGKPPGKAAEPAGKISAEEIQSPAPLDKIKQAPGQKFAYEK